MTILDELATDPATVAETAVAVPTTFDEAPVDEPGIDEAVTDLVETPLPALRTSLVVGCAAAAAAVMAGGLFEGVEGRVYPIIGALCGVATAAQASRRRSPIWVNLTIVGGIVGTGLVLLLPAGIDNLTRLAAIVSEAKGAAEVLRPPAEFLPGWRLLMGVIMASIGFAAGWVGIEYRRPALGLLIPLPAIAYAAISVPEAAKVASGIAAAVLFIVGLALLSSLNNLVDGAENAPGIGYELKRALKALPLLAVIVGLLAVAAQSDFLFPAPRFDPARDSVAPKAVPLSEVKDRVLFTVESASTGPWRIGILDVYTKNEWRLPAFAESTLERVPESGIVDPDLEAGIQATFAVADLGGAVLPGIPNTTAVIAQGPRLSYDARTGTIRLAQGQITPGLTYTVVGAAVPNEEQLRQVTQDPPRATARSLEIPAPPPEIANLLDEAPTANKWDRLDFVRRRLLTTVVAAGPGTPKPVPPERVVEMLFEEKKGSPFEVVAAQAMLARWAGVPARIGYGYDGGEEGAGGRREVRPKHGSSWLEVWFAGHGWLPVLGQPDKAQASLQPDGPTLENPDVAPSEDIAVQVYFPLRTEASSPWYAQIRRLVLFALPLLLVGGIAWVGWPAAWKAWRRSRARRTAAAGGVRDRVAQSYAEFRDRCTDLGLRNRSDSPLAFCQVLVDDREHEELAWLVTRLVWGDLRHDPSEDHALDAAELARSLTLRVAQAQPVSIRLIAAVSRLSVRHPYAPELAAAPRTVEVERAA
ncbi:MAG TPA: transglutaminase domain-containing protein [Acidimicrobiales bacterium]|nr:transglutaminase domain-containing protein [Acidimicrobiales bacterium]